MAMTGLDKITKKILAEAEKEVEKILAAADEECRAIKADYAARAARIKADVAATAEKEGRDLVARTTGAAETAKRNLLLVAEGDLVNEAFDGAEATVLAYDREKMLDLLTGLLAAAMLEQVNAEAKSLSLYGEEGAVLPDSYEVLMNAKDREAYGQAMLDGVAKKLIGKVPTDKVSKLRLSDKTVNIKGGFILRYGDIESNCSFDLLFAELRQTLEVEVSRALFNPPKKA